MGQNIKTEVQVKKTSLGRAGDSYIAVPAWGRSTWDFHRGYGALIGLVNDMYVESRNDEWKYRELATQ